MSIDLQLTAEQREERGKGASRRMRRLDDRIPAVIYGAGKDNVALTLSHKDIMISLQHEAFYSHVLTLNVGKAQEKVVLKDVQRHPYKNRILHVDFLRIDPKEKLKMHVPLHFIGEDKCQAIVKEGGVITHLMNELEVKCLPANLPEFIEIDVSNLGMDESLHLTDIKLPKGVELTIQLDDAHDHPVVNIHLPRAAKEDLAEDAALEAAAEAAAAVAAAPAEGDKE